MKYLRQFALILTAYFIGEVLNKLLNIPIPGNVLGILVLFSALYFKIIKIEHIEEVGEFILSHLSFFFVPASVGLMTTFGILQGNLFAILFICIITTAITMLATAFTVKLIKRRSQ